MGHDDWQRLLLSNSTSIRLHLFLSYCVCLPLNLTRQRLSILRGARARVQSRSEDESERASDGHSNWFQTKLFTHWKGKDDPIQLTWWQLDVGFCSFFFLWLLSCSSYLFLFELKKFLKLIFFLFIFFFSKYENKFDHLCVSLVVDCRFFFPFFLSRGRLLPPFSWKLRRRRKKQIGIRPFEVLWSLTVCPWEEESHSTHKTRNANKI